MGKTGGGRGTNQYGVKGVSQASRQDARVLDDLAEGKDGAVSSLSTRTSVNEAVDRLCDLIRGLGVPGENGEGESYAVEFNSPILGNPYLEGTGWLPDRETAEGVASIIIPALDDLARARVAGEPKENSCWVDPETEAENNYATLVSAKRDPNGEPAVEEAFFGDDWLVASAQIGLLSARQQATLHKVRDAWAEAPS